MRLLERKELNLTPIFLIGNAVAVTLLLFIELINFSRVGRIAQSKVPTLVELSNGESVRVSSINHYERSPQTITYFVGQTMTGLLSWNAVPVSLNEYSPNTSDKIKLDSGVQAGERQVTTTTWSSGFALSEDFRVPFLKQIANLTPPDVFNGTTQSILKVNLFSEPKKIGQGKWSIDMVAEIIIFHQNNMLGSPVEFNKTIFVRAIDTPILPKISSQHQQTASRARQAGIEIYKIQDLGLRK
jgi:hypothetical protein